MSQFVSGATLALSLVVSFPAGAAGTNPPPAFQDVFNLIRTNLAGVSEGELNEAAVRGFVHQLQPRVQLSADPGDPESHNAPILLGRSTVFDGVYGYVRVEQVEAGLAAALTPAFESLRATNRLKGLVLDLRFATGHDYAEAVAVAGKFLGKEQPLLDWGQGVVRSEANAQAWTLPLMLLVNQRTAGAAEALAAVLRQAEAGLLLGANTAGQGHTFKEFSLSNGARLLVASVAVKLADGTELPRDGVRPDIAVNVEEADERAYLTDPFKPANKAGARSAAARPVGRRVNEADLVRRQREGGDLEAEFVPTTPKTAEPEKLVVRDPALARALDLLKGIAVVQSARQP